MIIGLTGGIASGKSTVSNILKEKGFKIVDADIVANEIREKNNKNIEKLFGTTDKKKIRQIVFNDKNKLMELNNLLHPQIIEYFKNVKKNNGEEILIFDVPLLFETHMDELCDRIILVATSKNTQIERIVKRDKVSRELAKKIIDSQMNIDEKIERSDYIIWNNGTIEYLKENVCKVIDKIGE